MKIIILVISFVLISFAAPVFSVQKTYRQSDGTTFTATPKGDEYLNYIQTPQGDILLYNPKTKNYDYATVKNNSLVPSGIPYQKNNSFKKATSYKTYKKPSKEDLKQLYIYRKKLFNN